jgi:putative aldouronate transport system substrate-binding protein
MSSNSSARLSRRQFLRMAGTSAAGSLLLVACGTNPVSVQPTSAPTEPTAAAQAPTVAPAPTAVPAPTAMPTAVPTAVSEAVNLRYVFVGGAQKDLVLVQDALSALVKTKGLNANITLDLLDWGAYNDKVNLMNTGGEAFDLVFTAPWINNYNQNVANGTLTPLDDLLPAYAPKLWASMAPTTWNAARVDGKIYGVINQQIFPKQFGVLLRKDLAEKYQVNLTTITSFEQLTPIMQQIKDGESEIKYVYLGDNGSNLEIFGFDPIDQALGFPAVSFTESDPTVVDFLATAEASAYAERTAAWRKAQFTALDDLKQEEIDALYKAGQVAFYLNTVIKPGVEVDLKNRFGYEWVAQPIAPNYLTTGGVVATLTGIPVSSTHPAEAMQLLELINTDAEVYNLLSKGIEGTHWQWVNQDELLIELIGAANSGWNPNTDWEFGNQFNAYYTDPLAVGNWEKTKQINDSAKPSPILGFTFNRVPVETELAQTSEVWARVWKPIYTGDGDAATNLAAAQEELKNAGSATILAELQKQIDAWKASM